MIFIFVRDLPLTNLVNMVIYGNRFELPAVLPNRTHSAMKDLATLIGNIERSLGGKSGEALFQTACDEFRKIGFSEVIRPLNDAIEMTSTDVVEVYYASILLTLRNAKNSISRTSVLLSLLVIIAKCYEDCNMVRVQIPATVGDIRMLAEMATTMSDFSKTLISFVASRIRPVMRYNNLFVGHSGMSILRDNRRETTAKELSKGEETARTVAVESVGADDVAIVNAVTGKVIFQLKAMTDHNPEFRKECLEIVKSLGDIIPPPTRSQPDEVTEQLSLLAPRDVRSLLKNGRITTPRKKRQKL